jgi:hypothetical protein
VKTEGRMMLASTLPNKAKDIYFKKQNNYAKDLQ